MLSKGESLPEGLSLRPAGPMDAVFLATLYRSTRDDLRLMDAENEFVEMVIGIQQNAQTQGYGENHPDAMTFIIEKLGEKIGRVMVMFGEMDVRVLDISLIPQVRKLGLGTAVMRILQRVAEQVKAPLTLCVLRHNLAAIQFYHSLGFQRVSSNQVIDLLAWYPKMLHQNTSAKNTSIIFTGNQETNHG